MEAKFTVKGRITIVESNGKTKEYNSVFLRKLSFNDVMLLIQNDTQ